MDNITNALYPLYISQFVFGSVPIALSTKQNTVKPTKKCYDLVTCALALTAIVVFLTFRHNHLSLEAETDPLAKFIDFMFVLVLFVVPCLNLFWVKYQRTTTIDLWTSFVDIDAKMRSAGIRLDYRYIKSAATRNITVNLVVVHLFVVYMVATQSFSERVQAVVALLIEYCAFVQHACVHFSFLMLIRSLTHVIDTLADKIEADVDCLERVMCICHDLHDLLGLVLKIYALPLILSFACAFAAITFETYNVLCSVYTTSTYVGYAIATFLYVTFTSIERLVVVLACRKCMRSRTELKQTLFKLAVQQRRCKKVVREINAFALQLLHERFEIYAGKMFLIDLPIFTSVCGTATTYVILLWQTDSGVDLNYSMKKVFGVF